MLLQVNKMYFPDIGGVESVVKDYSQILNKYEEVVVLCISKRFSIFTKKEIINGVLVYRCASLGTFLSLPISIVFFFYLYILSRNARVIHIHEPFPLVSLGQFLIPRFKKIFITWHSDIVRQRFFKPFVNALQRLLCDRAETIISASENIINYSEVICDYKDKVKVIPLSIDSRIYAAPDNITLAGLPEKFVLFLGRLSNYKGIFQLLDAIDSLPSHFNFVVAGHGELSESVRSHLSERRNNIFFIDRFVTEEEKKFLLSRCAFFVFPSILPSEAFGILQLEAMVFKKAVINTNLKSGVPWVSPHEVSGLTVPPGDVPRLSAAIKFLYTHPDLAKRYGDNGYLRVKELFDSYVTEKKLLELYLLR